MKLSNEDLIHISNELNSFTKKDEIFIQGKQFIIHGEPSNNHSETARFIKIGKLEFWEQKLFKRRSILNNKFANFKRAGHFVTWIRTPIESLESTWGLILDNKVICYPKY